MAAAAERIVPVTLELGGKNPQIVFPDADDDHVVQSVINGMRFTRQGQSCTAGSRLFLHASIFDSFINKLVKKLSALKVGDPFDEATDMGAIINRIQFEKVCAYVKDGLEQKGSRLIMGGLPPQEGPPDSSRHRSGWIQVNQGLGILPGTSYGGFKQSGMGREYSLEGMLDSYTQRKCITVNLQY